VWDVPVKEALGGHGWNIVVNGWQVSGALFARTGFPYTVYDFQESETLVPNNYFGLLNAVPAVPLGAEAQWAQPRKSLTRLVAAVGLEPTT
jgi:hypothetical protein